MKHIISLGAGVQSSTMALMAAKGEIAPMPDFAVFADTQAEPESVYRWLDWLETQLPFPVYRVTKGNLETDALHVRVSKVTGNRYLRTAIPAYSKGETHGILKRQCTTDYKVRIIQSSIKDILGTKGSRNKSPITQWIGISTDEAQRMKDSREGWIINRYPLIEKNFTRFNCLDWMNKNHYPQPPRSACVFCPFHSDAEWLRLKTDEPAEFQRAVNFEVNYLAAQSKQNALKGTAYLHSSRKPLSEVVFEPSRQISLFGNECEGMCGV